MPFFSIIQAFLIDSHVDISLNWLTSTVAKIALSALKLLLAKWSFSVVQFCSGFSVSTLVSAFVVTGGVHPVKIDCQTLSSMDLMYTFTVTF